MAKRILTWADLEANPQLELDGLKVGDEIEDHVDGDTDLSANNTETNDNQQGTENANEEAADDTGGGAPPPDKPRDDN